jgi:hypothetical protein
MSDRQNPLPRTGHSIQQVYVNSEECQAAACLSFFTGLSRSKKRNGFKIGVGYEAFPRGRGLSYLSVERQSGDRCRHTCFIDNFNEEQMYILETSFPLDDTDEIKCIWVS